MADNVAITAGAGTTIATDDVGGIHYQLVKQAYGALDSATLVSPTNPLPVVGVGAFDVQTSFTRPADTTAYAANDAVADSTTAPTAFTLTGLARASGGKVMFTDIMITSSKPASLQGLLFIFNQAYTPANDNAALGLSDTDIANAVAVLPFYMSALANNSYAHLSGLAITAAAIGSADFRFAIMATAAYTPDSAEVIKVRAKGLRLD